MPTLSIRRLLHQTFLGLTALCLTTPGNVHGQTKLADPEAYREAKRNATAVFLDAKQPKEKRLEAAKHLGYPDERTMAALLEIAADQSQDDEVRWEAARRHPVDEKYLDAVLKILDDPRNGSEKLAANLVLDMSRRTTFRVDAPLRQRMQTVLRKLLKDPRDSVRLNAFRTLVASHDTVAVNQLADSLRRGQDIPIPLAEAIELLDLDGAVNHLSALRPYLKHADPRVQGLAARALAVDADSRPQIVALVKNRDTSEEVRRQALRGLARADDRFADYALPLLEDAGEKLAVRDAAMHAFAGRMNYGSVDAAAQIRFAKAVEKLAADNALRTGDGRKLKESAEQLFTYLRKAFPEVQKHYENR